MSPGMIDAAGRERISQMVRASMGWQGLTGSEVYASGRISRATLNRVKAADEVSDTMLRALGDVLGLPRDYLLYVGAADTRAIKASGGDPDLIRWTVDLVSAEEKPPGKPPTATAG